MTPAHLMFPRMLLISELESNFGRPLKGGESRNLVQLEARQFGDITTSEIFSVKVSTGSAPVAVRTNTRLRSRRPFLGTVSERCFPSAGPAGSGPRVATRAPRSDRALGSVGAAAPGPFVPRGCAGGPRVGVSINLAAGRSYSRLWASEAGCSFGRAFVDSPPRNNSGRRI